MLLARQANAPDHRHFTRMAGGQHVHGGQKGDPPVPRCLLVPSRMGGCDMQGMRVTGKDALRPINQNGLQARSAQINPDKHYYYSRAGTGVPVRPSCFAAFVCCK
ncbi:hypothetical protein SXCC_04096 [Gluconacetobacter sp. SXCC-1]|nr:hypothetical protein SXCC_04096 [Gluconacetobacter sp. SXCC-1]